MSKKINAGCVNRLVIKWINEWKNNVNKQMNESFKVFTHLSVWSSIHDRKLDYTKSI